MADQSIEQRANFEAIRYANCWEDADMLSKALAPLDHAHVLSIASGGDNCFAMLAQGASVVAVDLSIAQLATVKLKAIAITELNRDELLAFLGILPSKDRMKTYTALKPKLEENYAAFWDAHPQDIADGIIHAGKFERYFQLFRTKFIPFIHSKKRIEKMLEAKDAGARTNYYEKQWNNWRWRLLFRIFFSKFVMGQLGRDPEFFRYVDRPVSIEILERTKHALTFIPTHDNPYLHYILTGNYTLEGLPTFLHEDVLPEVRSNLNKLTLHHGMIQDAAKTHQQDGFDGYNLSDIFEYLSKDICLELYRSLLSVAKPNARVAYWNMMVPRSLPAELEQYATPDTELANDLFLHDKAWFYGNFHIDRVIKPYPQDASHD